MAVDTRVHWPSFQMRFGDVADAYLRGKERKLAERRLAMQEKQLAAQQDEKAAQQKQQTNVKTLHFLKDTATRMRDSGSIPAAQRIFENAKHIYQGAVSEGRLSPEMGEQFMAQQMPSPPELLEGIQKIDQAISAAQPSMPPSREEEQKFQLGEAKLGKAQTELVEKRRQVEARGVGQLLTGIRNRMQQAQTVGVDPTVDQENFSSMAGTVQQLREDNVISNELAQQSMRAIQAGFQNPEMFNQLEQMLVGRQNELQDVDKFTKDQLGGASVLVRDFGASPAVQENLAQAVSHPKFAKAMEVYGKEEQQRRAQEEQGRLREARAGASQINVGREGPTTSQRKVEQERLVDARQTLRFVADIKALGDPAQFLGYMNRAEFWMSDKRRKSQGVPGLGTLLGKLGPQERAQYEKAAEFRSIVDKYKSLEYKRLIGSAQTATEVKNLANSIINPNMSDVQFNAALETLERETQRISAASQEALTAGYDVGTEDYNGFMTRELEAEKLSEKLRAGKISKEAALKRFRELEQKYGNL